MDNSEQPVDNSQPQQRAISGNKESTGWGGARPGAGRAKGKMNRRSIQKMKIKKQFEDRVARHAQELFNAQVTLAKGTQTVVKRVKMETARGWRWSKFMVVQDPEEICEYLDGTYDKRDSEYYMITVEKPDSHAIDSLLDRAFGKAPQNLTIKDDRPDPIATILERFGLIAAGEGEDSGSAGKTSGSKGTPS